MDTSSWGTVEAILGVVALVAVVAATVLLVRGRAQVRLTESRLHEQHELLAIAGEVGRFGGWTVDVATGVGRWSPEVGVLLGLPPNGSQSVEMSVEMYLPEHRDVVRSALDRCITLGEPFEIEAELRRADGGSTVWISTIGRAERDAGGRVVQVIGAVQDVTDRVRAEQRAEASARSLETLADAVPVLVWTASSDARLTWVSRRLARYAGRSREDIVRDSWDALVHPDDREQVAGQWRSALATRAPISVEVRLRRGDGTYLWHIAQALPETSDDGTIRQWWCSATDIDRRRTLEEQHRVMAERLSATLESVGDAIVGVGTDGCITVLNRHAEEMFGIRREDVVGRAGREVFADALGTVFAEEFAEEFARSVPSGEPLRLEAEWGPGGRWLEVSAYPHPGGIVFSYRDTTDHRQLAQQLAHAQRLDSLGRLTGGVAHDFNNLLTVILGGSDVLAARVQDDPQLGEIARSVSSAARRGAELTARLLAFARKQPLDASPVDVNELVQRIQTLLDRTLGPGIGVDTELGAGVPRVLADAHQLENALLNLALNARDALPSGGRLRLATSSCTLDGPAAEQADVAAGRYVRIDVVDEGTGIPPEDLGHLFEPFFTTKDVGIGTGLGLPIVYGFVKQSQGHVEISSTLGAGTTVSIYLPTTAAQEVPGVDPEPGLQARRQVRVLLVEDDVSVRSVLRSHLEELGYAVAAADSSEEALRLLETSEFDLLLTDVVLPHGLSGPEMAERAVAARPDLRVLYVSGYPAADRPGGQSRAARADLLNKPFGRVELARAVQAAMDDTTTREPA